MKIVPCALCGYDAPQTPCPHCAGDPAERSLARPLRGPWTGILDGLLALPKGLWFLLRTRGLKRWLFPPLFVTSLLLVALLWWTFSTLNGLMDGVLPERIELPRWGWIEGLSGGWGWLRACWSFASSGVEWALNAGWQLLVSEPLRFVGWFLLGSLVVWYCFSIAYEALAGPFLDEVHARLEGRWFGSDPRSRLERPNDIPTERCVRYSVASTAIAIALLAVVWSLSALPAWSAALFLPLAFVPAVLRDRRYGVWLLWVARIEGRALWASLLASALTAALLVIALPLYFVPLVGYFLFAAVCGFATAVGLLDIPFERRGWPLGERLRFIARNVLPLLAFGVSAGLLLAVPILGPVLMVPAASIGGLWLLCRLDMGFVRERARTANRQASEPQSGTAQEGP